MFRLASSPLIFSLLAAGSAAAADVSGYLVATSDYVHRGVTQSDGHAALQAGVDLGFNSGVFLGAWASTVDIESPPDNDRRNELRVYLGYGFDLNEKLRVVLNTVAYRYPGADGDTQYDNQETSLSLGLSDRYWIEYAYSPNLYNTGRNTHNIELFSEWPLGKTYAVSGGIGHFRVDRPATSPANSSYYWQLGISRTFDLLDVDLRYHDADRAVWFTSTPDRIGARIVISARLSF